MASFIRRIWSEDQGQDIAEYAVMLAVILVLVVGTIRLIGSNANTAFSSAASSSQWRSGTPRNPTAEKFSFLLQAILSQVRRQPPIIVCARRKFGTNYRWNTTLDSSLSAN